MTAALIFIIFVVFLALAFDFINGFHDAANSVLTKWLMGKPVQMTASLRSQIRALLIHCGTDAAEADRLIAEAGGG